MIIKNLERVGGSIILLREQVLSVRIEGFMVANNRVGVGEGVLETRNNVVVRDITSMENDFCFLLDLPTYTVCVALFVNNDRMLN